MTGRKRKSERSDDADAPGRANLCLSFLSRDEFTDEYWKSLSNGGVFIITADPFEPREMVEVRLELLFERETLHLDAEVVHIVPKELAKTGATPGVAVQFLMPAPELRVLLGEFAGPQPRTTASRRQHERRKQPRAPSRVAARLDTTSGKLDARTRDLSRSGALVAVDDGERVPVGEKVRVALVHPTTGEELEVDAKVARQVTMQDGRAALGIQFEDSQAGNDEVTNFIDDVQAADHTRRLGGITGAIEELGLPNLLQMLSTCAPRGTLTVTREGEEGTLVFQGGNLVSARLGPVSGGKALKRMLSWATGRFEFHAVAEQSRDEVAAAPIDVAVLDALRQIDEEEEIGAPEFPPSARLRVDEAKLEAERDALDETAEAVIELAVDSFTVGAILDMIPEPDARVLTVLQGLIERGVVELVS
jgi:Tfp pilus assembly protein PilZ